MSMEVEGSSVLSSFHAAVASLTACPLSGLGALYKAKWKNENKS